MIWERVKRLLSGLGRCQIAQALSGPPTTQLPIGTFDLRLAVPWSQIPNYIDLMREAEEHARRCTLDGTNTDDIRISIKYSEADKQYIADVIVCFPFPHVARFYGKGGKSAEIQYL